MPTAQLILDHACQHEAERADQVFLTQPLGHGATMSYTWSEAMDQSRRMAAHLLAQGLKPGERVALLAKNSAHFMLTELAIWMAGGTTVAIFPTEVASNIAYVLQHSDARYLFIGRLDTWAQQKAAVPAGLPCIELPLAPDTGHPRWDTVIASTAPLQGQPRRSSEELAMLLYTSGSTGQPKGVMQTFGSVSRVTAHIVAQRESYLGDADIRVLSYLPLAHCFERAWVACAALQGGRSHVFFAESQATFIDDLKRARPNVFISVPRLWLKFQQSVLAQLPAAQLDALLDNPATAAAVRQKVLGGLGLDAVQRAGSGSAPLPAAVLSWYRKLGLQLADGYGMTEDFAYSHSAPHDEVLPGYVGKPNEGVQMRLADDDEILVKSPGQMAGYFRQPELTAESFTDDGFFRTGDLGMVDHTGQLKLTGRKKELFKTAKGKYVAPAPIENRLNAHPMLELSLVTGVGQPAACALVQLAETLRPRLADAGVKAEIELALTALLGEVNSSLAAHEQLQFLVVARELWSMDNGCLTPTMKIKRSVIEASLADRLDTWYAAGRAVLWA